MTDELRVSEVYDSTGFQRLQSWRFPCNSLVIVIFDALDPRRFCPFLAVASAHEPAPGGVTVFTTGSEREQLKMLYLFSPTALDLFRSRASWTREVTNKQTNKQTPLHVVLYDSALYQLGLPT